MSVNIEILSEEKAYNVSSHSEIISSRIAARSSGWKVAKWKLLEFFFTDENDQNYGIPHTIAKQWNDFKTKQVNIKFSEKYFLDKLNETRFCLVSDINKRLMEIIGLGGLDKTQGNRYYVLITEVIPPNISGIVCSDNKNSVIEICFGQMMTKGTVETTHYRLWGNELIEKNEVRQQHINIIKDGQIIYSNFEGIPQIEENTMLEIIKFSRKYNKKQQDNYSIEFFITEDGDIYFNDTVREKVHSLLYKHHVQLIISDGTKYTAKKPIVIYPGSIKGEVLEIDSSNDNKTKIPKSLNMHLGDIFSSTSSNKIKRKNSIFICETTKLEYGEYLNSAKGFIFKNGASLSHFASLLRTRKIPGVIANDIFLIAKKLKGQIELKCSTQNRYQTYSYKPYFDRHRDSLLSQTIEFPIISTSNKITNKLIGWKALNINFALNLGFKTPKSLSILFNHKEANIINETYPFYRFNNSKSQPYKTTLKNTIDDIFSIIDEKKVLICRSSSIVEDSVEHSAAGIFETIPRISSIEKLVDAIQKVSNSMNSPRALQYYKDNSINSHDTSISCLIQEYIKPNASGVLFIYPLKKPNQYKLKLEIAEGSSDGVTAGDISPHYMDFNFSNKNLSKKLNDEILSWPNDVLNLLSIPSLDSFIIQCINIVYNCNFPVDIEFIIDKKCKPRLVQIRPELSNQ